MADTGMKHDTGKTPVYRGLFKYFPRALLAVADVSAAGYKKYKTWGGWLMIDDGLDRYSDAMGRHMLNEQIEGDYDEETGCLHAAQEAWNALARLELILRSKDERKGSAV